MKSAAKYVVVQTLRGYKWLVSPLLPPSCRYVPSCSEYAMEAVQRHGAWRGGLMAIWRVLRCHPFVKGGFDPVPIKEERRPRISRINTDKDLGVAPGRRARAPLPTETDIVI